jgi:anti-sigma regulatory factor (Ser/Thr protein kinase)
MSALPLIQAAGGAAAWPLLSSQSTPDPPSSHPGYPGQLAGVAPLGGAAGFPRAATMTPGGDLPGVGAARQFSRAALERWQVGGRSDDITLVLSELLANALVHAVRRPGGWPVRIGLYQARPGADVLCAVADPSPTPPALRPPGQLAESGRGLRVVAELSDRWGYAGVPPRGKVVWATFAPEG